MPNIFDFSSTNQPFTMACWVRWGSEVTDQMTIFQLVDRGETTVFQYRLRYDPTETPAYPLTMYVVDATDASVPVSYEHGEALPTDTWMLVAGYYDPNGLAGVSYNGGDWITAAVSGTLQTSAAYVFEAGGSQENSAAMLMGPFRVWSRVLTNAELDVLYAAGP